MGRIHDYMAATGLSYEAAQREVEEGDRTDGIKEIENRMDQELGDILNSANQTGELIAWLQRNLTPSLAKAEYEEHHGS